MAFTFLLIQGKKTLDECPPLQSDPDFSDRRATIAVMVE
jgi:hypothetical protein